MKNKKCCRSGISSEYAEQPSRIIMFQKDLTYDRKDEGVGEMPIKGELYHVSP